MPDNSFCPRTCTPYCKVTLRSSLEGKIKKLIFIPFSLISTKTDTA